MGSDEKLAGRPGITGQHPGRLNGVTVLLAAT
jgi:hypothetical protein